MNTLNKKAFALIEYVMIFIIVMGAFLVMRSYIQRGIFGMSSRTGKTFAFGRQYDPQKTVDCGFDGITGSWYDNNCFKASKCTLGNATCEQGCLAGSSCANQCVPVSCSSPCGAGTDNCGNPCTGTSGCDVNGPPQLAF
jgi:hypothetical protein